MKKVFFQGTFDIIHAGHAKLFEIAKSYGDYLVIGLNSDELVLFYKNQGNVIPYEQKKFLIESIRWVDEVVKCDNVSPRALLEELDIDVFCVASEWISSHEKSVRYMEQLGKEVKVMPRLDNYLSTGKIKRRLLDEVEAGRFTLNY